MQSNPNLLQLSKPENWGLIFKNKREKCWTRYEQRDSSKTAASVWEDD